MSASKETITPEQLDGMMPKGEYVHTFVQAGAHGPLIGADWKRSDILKAASENGAELAGETAQSMGHGAVVWNDDTAVFVATGKEAP